VNLSKKIGCLRSIFALSIAELRQMNANVAQTASNPAAASVRVTATAGVQVRVEDYSGNGAYECRICGESVSPKPALHCSPCTCNPFHRDCVNTGLITCPHWYGHPPQRWLLSFQTLRFVLLFIVSARTNKRHHHQVSHSPVQKGKV
jgi:hypothetical protein